jgi:hypothetical protein
MAFTTASTFVLLANSDKFNLCKMDFRPTTALPPVGQSVDLNLASKTAHTERTLTLHRPITIISFYHLLDSLAADWAISLLQLVTAFHTFHIKIEFELK